MRRFYNIAFVLLATLLPALSACSDDFAQIDPSEPGAVTIKMSSSSLKVASRDVAEDPEYAIKGVKLFFYVDSAGQVPNAQAAAVTSTYKSSSYVYGSRTITVKLTDAEIAAAFPDGDECYVYAVANLDDEYINYDPIPNKPTLIDVKSTVLSRSFKDNVNSFVMSGLSKVKLDRTTSTMSTDDAIVLQRAAAKTTLIVNVARNFTNTDGTKYTPLFKKNSDGTSTIYATILNNATSGMIEAMPNRTEQTYGTYTRYYSATNTTKTETKSDVETVYDQYTLDVPFYSYATDWTSNFADEDTMLLLIVPWKAEDANEYKTYYYQIPINFYGKNIERNTHYQITVNVSMLGSETTDQEFTPDDQDLQYFVAKWNEDGIDLSSQLRKTHYLVASENAISLYNDDEASFEFNTCNSLTAYLTSVQFLYVADNKTVSLLQSTYDSDSNAFTPIVDTASSSYSSVYNANDENAWSVTSIKEAKDYIWNNYDKFVQISEEQGFIGKPDENTEVKITSSLTAGFVNFFAAAKHVANKVYSPVTYTIVLCNDKEHGGTRQTVTITQYPSKYITYGAADNVFVDGYYARLTPDSGYTTDDLPAGYFANGAWSYNQRWSHSTAAEVYASYSFMAKTLQSNHTYYLDSTYDTYDTDIYSGKTFAERYKNETRPLSYLYQYSPVNTPYEYIQGAKQSDLVNENTIDVHVSAFTSSDMFFNVKINNDTVPYYYRIGDPRKGTPFTYDPHTSTGTYNRNATYLYDYLDYCEKKSNSGNQFGNWDNKDNNNTNYYRYVKSWGSDASKILIGAEDTSYDDVISPLYKIQSSYGALAGWAYFEVAQKRCATYQEAGFPAGRWRLPTLAEVAFIVELQRDNIIQTIFTQSRYWTASGGAVKAPSSTDEDQSVVYEVNYKGNTSNYAFVRCVYDLWYWGEDPIKPTHIYHPKPTK